MGQAFEWFLVYLGYSVATLGFIFFSVIIICKILEKK